MTPLYYIMVNEYKRSCPSLRNNTSVYANDTVLGGNFKTCQMNARAQSSILHSILAYGYAIDCTKLEVYFEHPLNFDSPNYTSILHGLSLFDHTSSFIHSNYFAMGSISITLETQSSESTVMYVCIFSNLTSYNHFMSYTDFEEAVNFAIRCDNITAEPGSRVIHTMDYNITSAGYLFGAFRSLDGIDFVTYNLSIVRGFFNKSDFWYNSENYTFTSTEDIFTINLAYKNTCILFYQPPGGNQFIHFHVDADRIPYIHQKEVDLAWICLYILFSGIVLVILVCVIRVCVWWKNKGRNKNTYSALANS